MKGNLKEPIELDIEKMQENFFGTKSDMIRNLLEEVIIGAYSNEFNEDGSHNLYDTIHIHSDRVLFGFMGPQSYYYTGQAIDSSNIEHEKYGDDTPRQVGSYGDRFKVMIVYNKDRKDLVRLTCSGAEDIESTAVYGKVLGL